ncbi:hypothetical protein CR513_22256, partial [Mucuna pruriens]
MGGRGYLTMIAMGGDYIARKKRGTCTPQCGSSTTEEINHDTTPPHFRELIVDPFDRAQDPHSYLRAFQAQVYISEGMTPSSTSYS